MVKKCLIAIAVVALLASTVQAASPSIKKELTWPWTKTYAKLDICTFPVTLEVGHYVQVKDCQDLEMRLEQVLCADIGKGDDKFPCYGDPTGPDKKACVDFEARANFPAVFGATFASGADTLGSGESLAIVGGSSVGFEGGNSIVAGDYQPLKICMTAWSVNLWNTGGATSGVKKVGEITIDVKPPNETYP